MSNSYVGALAATSLRATALWSSCTRIFQPQNATATTSFNLLAPLNGKAYGIGLKSAFFSEALQTSVALGPHRAGQSAQSDIVVTTPPTAVCRRPNVAGGASW